MLSHTAEGVTEEGMSHWGRMSEESGVHSMTREEENRDKKEKKIYMKVIESSSGG